MVDLRVKCDRCGGAGIYYIGVLNGHGVPAHPDAGICWKCHGERYLMPKLSDEMVERISRFIEKHELNFSHYLDHYKEYIVVYTDTCLVKFNRYDSGISVKRRQIHMGYSESQRENYASETGEDIYDRSLEDMQGDPIGCSAYGYHDGICSETGKPCDACYAASAMDQAFICVARCPELDCDGGKHCTDTKKGIQEREERYQDYCPCGNQEKWKPLGGYKYEGKAGYEAV